MNLKQVKSTYSTLSAEERFRLILAASGRDDDAERQQLVNAGQTKNLSFSDHWPYAQAFSEISSLVFMELMEEATVYNDLLLSRNHQRVKNGKATNSPENDTEEFDESWQREFDLLLVTGCILHLKLKGWELFCEELQVPDRLLWQQFPGYHRLDRLLQLSKGMSFYPKGLLRWLNRKRPKGTPKLKRLPLTAKKIARSNEQAYRIRARWWAQNPEMCNKT
jgi:hypothetical protein